MNDQEKTYDFIRNKTCPYCQSKIKAGADFHVCSYCGTPHHKECWNENGGCTTYGCANNPNTEKKVELQGEDVGNATVDELRARIHSPDRAMLIDCPNCKAKIEEGSVYCKFCGFNVAENKFDETEEAKQDFIKEYKQRYREKINLTRKRFLLTIGSFAILIGAVILLFYLTVNKLNAYFSSDEYRIKSTVELWKTAWENRDIDKYKSYMTNDYEYYGKDGKKVDLKEKLKRIEASFKNNKDIRIQFSDFAIVNDSSTTENDKKVIMQQEYTSDKLKENGTKLLRVYRGEDTGWEWKIYREFFY